MSNPEEADDGRPEAIGVLDDRPGPARPLSAARAAGLVAAALERANRPARVPHRFRRAALVAAVVMLLAAGAVAALALWVLPDDGAPASRPAAEHSAPPAAMPAAPAPGAPRTESPAQPATAPALPGTPAPSALPAGTPPSPAVAPPPNAPAAGQASRPPTVRAAAADLLAGANRLRAERDWVGATRMYDRARRASPGSDTAYTAGLAAAELRLARLGDARGALLLFQAALQDRPHGALAEDAAFGAAECLRALGDAAGERQALEFFLAGWPAAAMADRARERLRQLGSSSGP